MKTPAQTRLVALVLAVLTLAAMALAIANLVQETNFEVPTDGVLWTETNGGLLAKIVPSDTPAQRAGIRAGDVLTAINEIPTLRLAAAQRAIFQTGVWGHANYSLLRSTGAARQSTALEIGVYLAPADSTDYQVLRLIALVYLAIGLYVLFRRWTAPQSTHFFVFCLTSFVLYAFRYTGELDGLDKVIFIGNALARALQPALFLHFALSFSGETSRLKRTAYALLYLPGAALLYLRYLSLTRWSVTGLLTHRLDQIDLAYLAMFYVSAAGVFWFRYAREKQALERQQLKWLSRGTLLTITPFTALYVIPYLADWNVPAFLSKLAVLSLLLLPLTFSWAIVRYRLMDVDLIFKRGVAYTLATAALVGLYFGVIAAFAEIVHEHLKGLQSLRIWGLMIAVIVTGLVFDPLKRAIQARVDRLFDQKRVNYRETLVEFGRQLNAQTDLNALVNSVVERLHNTLLVTRVAVFLADEGYSVRRPRFTLVASHGLGATVTNGPLDLGFLALGPDDQSSHLFFETPQSILRLPDPQRATAAALDLHYYVPCRAARHEGGGQSTVAVIGLGRTGSGDFLSSEDMELLESLAGYIGIAIQNAQLYRRLEQKILDFERLRDFNENIVESINVGVFALDPDDRIESWNAQMEAMHGSTRNDVLRRPAREVLPPEFADELDHLKTEQGIHTLYKFRLSLPDGEPRTANITVAPLLNRDLEAVGRIVIVDDISNQVSMEAQLTQAEKLSSIGLLAAGVAHEVNTPLAVISSYTQMLGKQLRMDESAQAKLGPVIEKITQQTFRASEIVNGLLNFSRLSSVDFTRVDLNQIVARNGAAARAPDALLRRHRRNRPRPATWPHLGQPRQIATGPRKPHAQCTRRAGRQPRAADHRQHPPGGCRDRTSCRRQRRWHGPRCTTQDLRPVLHHQVATERWSTEGHGPGARRDVRHRPGTQWNNRRDQRARRRHRLPSALPHDRRHTSCPCPRHGHLHRCSRNSKGAPKRCPRLNCPTSHSSPLPSEGARILIIDDEAGIRDSLETLLTLEGFQVDLAPDGNAGLDQLARNTYDLLLLDLALPGESGIDLLPRITSLVPGLPVIMITAYGTVGNVVDAIQAGAANFVQKPWDNEKLLADIRTAIGRSRAEQEVVHLKRALKQRYSFENIVGKSEPMLELFQLVEQVAPTRSTVLIQGESGTGKELIAKAIHANSPRRDRAFVPVNTGAVPSDLLESTLFGHERGAFTSAVAAKKGLFEVADGGTLFLDEIGTMSIDMQAKVLRVLQDRRFMHVGGTQEIQVDVRIIAATNVNLQQAVKEGRFREDLFFRLNVIPIELPPLRQRKGDVPLLAAHYLRVFSQENASTRPRTLHRGAADHDGLRLAGKRPRAGKRDGASCCPFARAADHAGSPAQPVARSKLFHGPPGGELQCVALRRDGGDRTAHHRGSP